MKNILFLILSFASIQLFAQPNTEVFLAEIETIDGKVQLLNLRNISNNHGYDNQPSFFDDKTILFSSTRNGQTDIAKYDIPSTKITWVSNTQTGSEYSPLRIPESDKISSVRLDTSGLQRLYAYSLEINNSELIRDDAKVGYHFWYSKDILMNTVLVENRMDLVLSNLKEKTNTTIEKNVGRSLHKIPNSDLISYIVKAGDSRSIKSFNPITGESNVVSPLPKNTEDICWLSESSILVPTSRGIYNVKPNSKENPSIIALPKAQEIGVISRMAVSSDGKYLALVAEEPASKIVQKQVDSYNAGDLDAFVNCYSKNVVVTNFPNDTLYVGHEKMRENYRGLSPNTKVYDVEVVKRITIGNKVIDHEKVTGNEKTMMQVAIYEVNNGAIQSMRFIFDKSDVENPENIVQQQLDAYNARNIDAFLNTYSESIQVHNFPNVKNYTGKQKMREGYASFFDSTPDLNCTVKKRIVIRNMVIDEEYITANGNNFSAVAIYETEKGKISKVTFVQ